jgi:glycosyltransferase involved in cell wall biosynthesis
MSPVSIAYVVPTKDRPADLRKLLDSLQQQTSQASQIVIVDGSDTPIEKILTEYPTLPLTYVRVYPPSLARQRNAGMAALDPDISVAGYLDDDLELAPDATERMNTFWNKAQNDIGGAAFTIVNQPGRGRIGALISSLFLLNSSAQGRVLCSGFATSILPRETTERTDWLYGGATLWRREIIEAYQYDEWYIGHGYLEDLDYSHRVAQQHSLYVVAEARCWHWPKPVKIEQNFALGRQQILNRIYFVRKFDHFSRAGFVWAMFGQSIRNLFEPLQTRDRAGWIRFRGNLRGYADLFRYGVRQTEGIWK